MGKEKVRAAMLAFGGIAKSHKRAYERLKAEGFPLELTAICDIDENRFKKAVEINLEGNPKYDLSGQTLYTRDDEMLKNEDFDMVDICLPTFLHKEYACKYLKAGKHVFCEKPMALSFADCGEMLDTAKKYERKLMIGQCLRFEPLYLFLKRAIDSNEFGRVKYAKFTRLSSKPLWGFENWYGDTKRCGGAILDLHIHDVDMVRFLFGEPVAVSAVTYDTDTRWAVIDSRFRYDDDKIVVADASWDEDKNIRFSMGYRVRFERAEVIMEGGVITVYPEGGKPYEAPRGGEDRMAEEIKALATCIMNGAEDSTNPPESAADSVRLVEMLRKSSDLRGAYVDVRKK